MIGSICLPENNGIIWFLQTPLIQQILVIIIGGAIAGALALNFKSMWQGMKQWFIYHYPLNHGLVAYLDMPTDFKKLDASGSVQRTWLYIGKLPLPEKPERLERSADDVMALARPRPEYTRFVFQARRREFESRLPLHVALGLASRPKNKMVSGKYTRRPQNSREIGKKLTNFRAFSFTLFLLHGLASEC